MKLIARLRRAAEHHPFRRHSRFLAFPSGRRRLDYRSATFNAAKSMVKTPDGAAEARAPRHAILNCCASGVAQRRVSTTPRCGSVATTLSSFSCSGANLVQPGTEAARFTSFHLS